MTRAQEDRYKNLCDMVNKKEITMNKAYKEAKKEFLNANGDSEDGFGGGFKDWVTHAQNEGWIEQGFQVLNTILAQRGNRNQPPPPPPPQEQKSTTSPILWIGLGAVVIVGGIVIYKLSKSK